jgi:uncharacterized membrane protein YdbT with pleckstrin-like domain
VPLRAETFSAACLSGGILTGIVCLQHRDLLGDYNQGIMPRVGEFCPSNVAQLVLGVVIVVTLVVALGVWLFHSPGHATSIEQPTHTAEPLSK